MPPARWNHCNRRSARRSPKKNSVRRRTSKSPQRLESLAAEKTAAEATGIQLQHESDQVRARIAEIDHELKAARLELDAARERKANSDSNWRSCNPIWAT